MKEWADTHGSHQCMLGLDPATEICFFSHTCLLLSGAGKDSKLLTCPRNSLGPNWSKSQTVISRVRRLSSFLRRGEYTNLCFHIGSQVPANILVLLLLFSLELFDHSNKLIKCVINVKLQTVYDKITIATATSPSYDLIGVSGQMRRGYIKLNLA